MIRLLRKGNPFVELIEPTYGPLEGIYAGRTKEFRERCWWREPRTTRSGNPNTPLRYPGSLVTKAKDPGKLRRAKLERARAALSEHEREWDDYVDENAHGILVWSAWAFDNVVREMRVRASAVKNGKVPDQLERNLKTCIRNGFCLTRPSCRKEGTVRGAPRRKAIVVDAHEYALARYCQRTAQVQQVRVPSEPNNRWRRVDLRVCDSRGLLRKEEDQGLDKGLLDQVSANYGDKVVAVADVEVWWSLAASARTGTATAPGISTRQVTLRIPREALNELDAFLQDLLRKERPGAYWRVETDR